MQAARLFKQALYPSLTLSFCNAAFSCFLAFHSAPSGVSNQRRFIFNVTSSREPQVALGWRCPGPWWSVDTP